MSSNSSPKGQYTTLRIAPSIYASIKKLVAKVSEKNRAWNVSAFVNVGLLDFIEKFQQFNEETVDALWLKYESLRSGKGNLK